MRLLYEIHFTFIFDLSNVSVCLFTVVNVSKIINDPFLRVSLVCSCVGCVTHEIKCRVKRLNKYFPVDSLIEDDLIYLQMSQYVEPIISLTWAEDRIPIFMMMVITDMWIAWLHVSLLISLRS